jgi:hypothetical protein
MWSHDEVIEEIQRLWGVYPGPEWRIKVHNDRGERQPTTGIKPGWSYEIERDTARETKR